MKTLIIILLIGVFALNTVIFAGSKGTLSLQPDCHTFYAGREHTLTIVTKNLTGERLNWNLRYAGRTLASGQKQIPANGKVNIPFNFPELNEGVVAEVEFNAWVGKKGLANRHKALGKNKEGAEGQRAKAEKVNIEEGVEGQRAKAERLNIEEGVEGQRAKAKRLNIEEGRNQKHTEIRRCLYFFYPNPFIGQKETLKELKIGVWEPNEEEALSELLTELALPFAKVADPANCDGQVLLIPGLDFDENPGVAETLLRLVEKGEKVILMPPISGTFPGFAENVDSIRLGKNDFIREIGSKGQRARGPEGERARGLEGQRGRGEKYISKKLDNKIWNGKAIATESMKLTQLDGVATLEVEKNTKGFSFCEIRKGKGVLIITTWDIVKGAKESPTPVYLLREMFY